METSKLPDCTLCRTAPAVRTNSHIFSWFLIRDLVNKEGVKERDNEVIFGFDGKTTQTHIGREQSAEDKAIRVKGRPLTEEEIEHIKKHNVFTRDHYLCDACEKKLGMLETTTNELIISKMRKHTSKAGSAAQLYNVKEGDLLRLFIYSLVWRAAVTNYEGFEMKTEHKEQLRQLLAENLNLDRKVLLEDVIRNSAAIRGIGASIYFLETSSNNMNLIAMSDTNNPYSGMINELGFQLFFDKAVPDKEDPLFRDTYAFVDAAALKMRDEQQLSIAFLSDDTRKKILGEIYRRQSRMTMKEATIKFIEGFLHATRGVPPTMLQIHSFQQNLIKRSNVKIENYTEEDQQAAITATIQQLLGKR